MAGEWIKFEKSTLRKPEVLRMARLLGVTRYEVLGRLIEFWTWADAVCVDGVVDGVVDAHVDDMVSCPGFAASLEAVKWIEFDRVNQRMTFPNFTRHNGESAKKRGLSSDRQARWRVNSVDASVDAPPSTSALPEKRREEKNNTLALAFAEFWISYPRKEKKPSAEKAYLRLNPDDALRSRMLSALLAHKMTDQWQREDGKFIPHASSWLNGRRWEDEVGSKVSGVGGVPKWQ